MITDLVTPIYASGVDVHLVHSMSQNAPPPPLQIF